MRIPHDSGEGGLHPLAFICMTIIIVLVVKQFLNVRGDLWRGTVARIKE